MGENFKILVNDFLKVEGMKRWEEMYDEVKVFFFYMYGSILYVCFLEYFFCFKLKIKCLI